MFTEGFPNYEKHGMYCAERKLMMVTFNQQIHDNCFLKITLYTEI